jgi:hypothetical protein
MAAGLRLVLLRDRFLVFLRAFFPFSLLLFLCVFFLFSSFPFSFLCSINYRKEGGLRSGVFCGLVWFCTTLTDVLFDVLFFSVCVVQSFFSACFRPELLCHWV